MSKYSQRNDRIEKKMYQVSPLQDFIERLIYLFSKFCSGVNDFAFSLQMATRAVATHACLAARRQGVAVALPAAVLRATSLWDKGRASCSFLSFLHSAVHKI